MLSYIDIRVLPDAELSRHDLLSGVVTRLHRQLVQSTAANVGISFPGYDGASLTLGGTLRLIGPAQALEPFASTAWLAGLREHTRSEAMREVPSDASHRTLRRIQVKSSPERLLRRQMRRHDLSEAELERRRAQMQPQHVRLPFVLLASSSTGQPFRLHLRLGEVEGAARSGPFNAYGLSQEATIPWF